MRNYKEQKEKSNKLKHIIKHNLPKSIKITHELKEEGTRNLREELEKSSSINNNNNDNNSSNYSTNNSKKKEMKKNMSANNDNEDTLFNNYLLKEIKDKKHLIELNLSKCKNSIIEKKKVE